MPAKKASTTKKAAPKKAAAEKKEPCVWHPPNRNIGGLCMECGFSVGKK